MPTNLCFREKIRKNVYPCKPQFYYIKVGCKGVFVTRTCFRDVLVCCIWMLAKCANLLLKWVCQDTNNDSDGE